MREKVFRFKQFSVRNERSAMKVGTDGVLLGAWCDVQDAHRVLDVGTGTGLIALMVAQRNAQSVIDAVEIDAEACSEARRNFDDSPWGDRMRVIHADFIGFAQSIAESIDDARKYDLIVSNPPYFTEDTTSSDSRRAAARHTGVSLTYTDLINAASRLLAKGGKISLISPVERSEEINAAALQCGLNVLRKLTVYPKPGVQAKRLLWELGYDDAAVEEDELTIETSIHNDYTPAYIALTREFYLKM